MPKKTFRKDSKGALLNILKTEENYTENYKIMATLKKTFTYIFYTYIQIEIYNK